MRFFLLSALYSEISPLSNEPGLSFVKSKFDKFNNVQVYNDFNCTWSYPNMEGLVFFFISFNWGILLTFFLSLGKPEPSKGRRKPGTSHR